MSTEPTAAPDLAALRDALHRGRRVPTATYRLQLQSAFTFEDARAVVAYLARLGISDAYASPLFRAKPGSTHGYDVCDFGQLNPELGGEPAFTALAAELAAGGMGLVVDFVPNHMAVEPVLNPWWRDVLEHGPASAHARFFDIDWSPEKPELRGKVLLPFLGDHYGRVLERGELALEFHGGELAVVYAGLSRPLDPKCYPAVLRRGLDALRAEAGEADLHLQEFLSILTALDNLPAATDPAPERVAERLRESRFAKERLARLADAAPRVRQHIDDALAAVNGTPDRPDSFDALHALLEVQSYRLSYWKTAAHEINYRRFFDINQLAGLRVEEPAAFAAMHALVLQLVGAGTVTGLRLDHIDGLFDPAGYLARLQDAAFDARAAAAAPGHPAPAVWRAAERERDPDGPAARPLYVVVEKILSGGEALPNWPAEGTTGYDFLNDVSRLQVNPRNARAVRQVYVRFTERPDPFADVVYDCKKLITWTSLAAELNVLAHALDRLSEGDRRARDFTLDGLREALREVAVCFPVYRTYVDAAGTSDTDRQVIDQAIRRARQRNRATEESVFDFVRGALLPDRAALSEEAYRARLGFAMKFQQYTGPLQAKGLEDTAFYRYNVLVSLNEVGGDPQRFGGTVAQFHQANQARCERAPRAMLATATHDTKRGEDARARLHVLSEVPGAWGRRVERWAAINTDCRTTVDAAPAPDRNDEYLFYQALVGSWPAGLTEPVAPPELVPRLKDYMAKATREAKVHTSWITANEGYDQAVARFVEEALTGPRAREFLTRFVPFQRRVAHAGMINSLAQLVLKVASPGVPDFYQGTELWDLSLVDPDNRRPVDYGHRAAALAELEPCLDDRAPKPPAEQAAAVADWLANWPDGRIKLFVTACGLRLRRSAPDLFLNGAYVPLAVEGERADHAVAFARRLGDEWVVAVVPRLVAPLSASKSALPVGAAVWGDTVVRLPPECTASAFRNAFTREAVPATPGAEGATVRLADALGVCPVALLRVERP
ncbi:maltooligosyl trehalose synthase : Maltooligosyltrehalose synthase OS=Geobacter bemidjiensis (strain Bem / ATCC BAA-1014 / DSM 16622) GN=Gbem_0134 PE=4 SV=1: Alpha-amylase [Gemmataceae bacterium]|nr:maltooligosyl trehalose synthase : Maltooligosyltrehalose synthase OS=Geobacter bemidjiensis (strain Bem / ATCC BAA-1014 / DSM 16622) GN=Gbem_0134 PE=4 SV=1: Alpha-amylase [Gemmataceae bacterium]VTU01559.1 maltooligosyl trehalose synthase : Maltooligosyltrehalose synthase OS=Geobacter bemidjiensis (strain Bem / ATCC BAA-1014 / DSM 16622) GN=Gbem_0134 PE=4 SV=1: Alpha-amylase [Gemmataceae bacterium]